MHAEASHQSGHGGGVNSPPEPAGSVRISSLFTHRGIRAVKLVERELHLSSLKSMLANSMDGDSRVAVLTGPVASGKSALAQALVEHAHDLGALVLQARCSPAEQRLRLEAVRQLVDTAPKPDRVIEIPLGPSYRSRNASPDSAPSGPLDSGRLTARDFCNVLLELAGELPVLVTVDDFEYADEDSVHYLSYVVRRMRNSRIMVVIGIGGAEQPGSVRLLADLLRHPYCCPIRLRTLSRAAAGELLTARLGERAPRALADQHWAASGGNPLLLHALIDDLTASPQRPGECRLVAGEHYAQAVITCLYRSAPHLARAAAVLAVLGGARPGELLEHLLHGESVLPAQALRALTASGLTTSGGRFCHPRAREAVLAATDSATRTALHARAAAWLYQRAAPAPQIAGHLLAAGPAEQRWQTGVLQEAAHEALLGQDDKRASACLELALAGCTDQALRAELIIELAEVTWRDSPSAAMRRMLPLQAQLRERALDHRHCLALAKTLLRGGRFDAAQDVLARLEAPPGTPASTELYIFDKWLETSYPPFGRRYRGAPGSAPAPAPTALPAGTGAYLHAIEMLAAVLRSGAREDIVTAAEQALRDCTVNDRTMEAASTLIAALFYADRTDSAAVECDRILAQATQRAAPAWEAVFASLKAQIAYRQGDMGATIALARRSLSAMSATSWGVGIGVPLGSLLMGAAVAADHDTAEAALAHDVPETLYETRFGIHYRHARGTYYLLTGRPHTALRELLTCGDLMTQWDMDIPSLVPWRLEAAQAHLHLGQHAQAAHLINEQVHTHTSMNSRTTGTVWRLRAALEPPRRRTRLLTDAIGLLTTTGDRLELTRALADQTHAHTAAGDTTAARRTRTQALTLIEECGAHALKNLLTPPPATPCPPPTTPAPAHTPLLSTAERRVASLVARGYTNRQVARHLYITNSTVEQHMTRVYRKLNITRRTDLPPWLTHHHP
ncbi:AAA family ATPase [Streptomyces sp. NPDC060000]|uniref:helix-turn-helix transcriptional regulator n=1 Tax=Streptomyces sp. NPDC060000 TaxID=3347031 RepID=UPI00367C01CA